MKKIYVAPLTEAISADETEMICASILNEGSTSENSITNADSREFDDILFFDED